MFRPRPRRSYDDLGLRPVRPASEDVGAWVAAILGFLFTLAVMFWPGGWNNEALRQMADNTTVVGKTDPSYPPPNPHLFQ
jgi:hypothetical protein